MLKFAGKANHEEYLVLAAIHLFPGLLKGSAGEEKCIPVQ